MSHETRGSADPLLVFAPPFVPRQRYCKVHVLLPFSFLERWVNHAISFFGEREPCGGSQIGPMLGPPKRRQCYASAVELYQEPYPIHAFVAGPCSTSVPYQLLNESPTVSSRSTLKYINITPTPLTSGDCLSLQRKTRFAPSASSPSHWLSSLVLPPTPPIATRSKCLHSMKSARFLLGVRTHTKNNIIPALNYSFALPSAFTQRCHSLPSSY